MEEIWKSITGYEHYQVSNFGRIRNYKGEILKSNPGDYGYLFVGLYKDSVRINGYVHKIVCTEFNGPKPDDKTMCLHRDDIKAHNTPDNLYWGTHEENVEDKIKNGKTHKGESNGLAKLTWSEVREMRRLKNEQFSLWTTSGLAKKFKISVSTASHILRNETWIE